MSGVSNITRVPDCEISLPSVILVEDVDVDEIAVCLKTILGPNFSLTAEDLELCRYTILPDGGADHIFIRRIDPLEDCLVRILTEN